MTDRLTLATSTGLPFAVLAFHAATGMVALVAGFVAVATRKGGTWHRRSGLAFTYAMVALGLSAVAVSAYEGKETFTGGVFPAYLVFSGWTTVRPLREGGRRVDVALMVLAFTITAATYLGAFTALGRPGNRLEGVPAGMLFFMGTIGLLAAVGDARMIRAGGLQGARRLARHLWRMCFGLFIASGSFFLGQLKFISEPIRKLPLLLALGVAPLVVLLYWMWRVRLRQNLRGMTTASPAEARRLA